MPIHVYDVATSRPVAILLRPGKTPSGHEVRRHISRLVRRIRRHWPHTRLTIRGDGHYGRPEAMAWCEANAVDYIFGLPGNAVLNRLLEPAADDVRVRRAESQAPVLRRYAETRDGAKSWGCERRVAARIEASTMGLDIRCVVTNLRGRSAEWLYDTLYCERGQAENLIKLHKGQLASDRTSCRSALANQVRLVLHTAAYWLMLTVRDANPKPQPLATAEFLVVDTETNGRAGDACQLTEIGAVLVGGGELHDRWETLLSVRAPLTRGIQRFTGISQAMVDAAPPPEGVSSTVRCRSTVESRRSWIARSRRPV